MPYYRQQTRGVLGAAPPPTVGSGSIPASVGGVNALDSVMMMPPQDCIYTYNLMPVEYGLRLRQGFRQWATGVNGDVRTIVPYEGDSAGGANDALFAVSENGIYDVTLFNTTAPTQDIAFTTQGDAAGTGVYTEFTNDAAEHYLFYADGLNGLFQYTEGAGWTVPVSGTGAGEWSYDPGSGLTGFPVDQIVFITVHKLRIWVILEDSEDAYYLPVAAVAGELKKFTFGSKMPHGGRLMNLSTWTVDGGDGVDDYFLALSKSGDLLVYRGSDPESTEFPWVIVGTWFVGQVPASRRLTATHGGELYLLSSFGITSIRDLLQGTVANELRTSPSAKVNRFLRADVDSGLDSFTWALNIHPADGFMQVITPEPTNTPYVQYNQNLSTKAWGFWEAVPQLCAETWNAQYMMGGKDGVVYIYDGVLDGGTLAGDAGEPVEFRLLTSFQSPGGEHAKFKRAGLIRTIGVLSGTVSVSVDAVYDYNVSQQVTPPPVLPPNGEGLWDSAVWDDATWDQNLSGADYPSGALGVGRAVAVGLAGSASNRITVVGWDLMLTQGGYL